MSYTVAIVVPPIAPLHRDAWKELDALIDQEGIAPPVFRRLHDVLTERFPCLCSFPDDEVPDDAVWSDGPLWDNFGQRAAVLGLVFPQVKTALPFLIESAVSFGLVVFDWQTEQIHRPDGFGGFALTLENEPPLRGPTLQQLDDAVDRLNPKGGPGFLILESDGDDYMQAAGGRGAFTAEWREYAESGSGTAESGFRHWVAGLPGSPPGKNIKIPTNGAHLTVKENERLCAADVKTIIGAFAGRKHRPADYSWRDITSRFLERS